MRKYENVDIVAVLGAVIEINTEHYKSDFKYDLVQLKKAVLSPDGENNRFLWMSRESGTWCVREREAYIKGSEAYSIWNGSATILGDINSYMSSVIVTDRIMAYAVVVKGHENGRVMGDLYQLDYRDSVKQIQKAALPLHTVSVKYKDGTDMTLPHAEHDGLRQRLYNQHGKMTEYRVYPEDEGALQAILNTAREKREKESTRATFKVRVQNPRKPSVTKQIKAGMEQIARRDADTPSRSAVKRERQSVEV